MSSIEMAVRNARAIETLLVERLGASGKGLHEKLNSVEKRLPPHIVKTARWIATLRNSAVHQHDFEIANPEDFMNAAARVMTYLEALPAQVGGARDGASDNGSTDGGKLRLEPLRTLRDTGSGGAAKPELRVRRPQGNPRRNTRASGGGKLLWLPVLLILILFLFVSGKVRIESGYLLIESQRAIRLPGF